MEKIGWLVLVFFSVNSFLCAMEEIGLGKDKGKGPMTYADAVRGGAASDLDFKESDEALARMFAEGVDQTPLGGPQQEDDVARRIVVANGIPIEIPESPIAVHAIVIEILKKMGINDIFLIKILKPPEYLSTVLSYAASSGPSYVAPVPFGPKLPPPNKRKRTMRGRKREVRFVTPLVDELKGKGPKSYSDGDGGSSSDGEPAVPLWHSLGHSRDDMDVGKT